MSFSEKQNFFARFLLNKIGFEDSWLLDEYFQKLLKRHCKIVVDWDSSRFLYSKVIEELLDEVNSRKQLGSIKLKVIPKKPRISATDLSNFNFCSASYSISKSFEIKQVTSEEQRIIGLNMHESLRLIDNKFHKGYSSSDFKKEHVLLNKNIVKIKKCELIFAGHTSENKFFENKEFNFIGQPDYIFKDPNGKYFVVEEKFKYLRNKTKNIFFHNHIVQIKSYIEYIKKYKIDYGILIKWHYDIVHYFPSSHASENALIPQVHSVSIKVIKSQDYTQLLTDTMLGLTNLIDKNHCDFLEKVSPIKCAGCVVNQYCAHKTNNLNILNFPYNRNDLKLKYVPFPEDLKKEEKSKSDIWNDMPF